MTNENAIHRLLLVRHRKDCTDLLAEALDMAIEALQQGCDKVAESCDDLISRQAAIDALEKVAELFPWRVPGNRDTYDRYNEAWNDAIGRAEIEIEELPSAQPEQRWIPCSERLPEDIRPVLVTWKNTDPASYYQYIVGKHFIGTAHYCKGKWYWYSSVTEDLLAEYEKCDSEEFDEAIEVVAWMPLPEPYKDGDENG